MSSGIPAESPARRKGYELLTTVPHAAGQVLDQMFFRHFVVCACEHGVWAYDLEQHRWTKVLVE